jgi:hypothetical protein
VRIARPEDRATLKRELAQAECLGKTSDGKTIYLWQRNGQEDARCCASWAACARLPFARWGRSGKRRDTDGYDDDYLHLILWDEEDLEIVGAYRFMPTAMQVEKRGVEGLYSYSLFHYDDKMQDVLEHGIELGRSFIQPRYWGAAGWTICGPALAPIWRVIRTIAICLARSRFPAACRLPRGICWWRFTACGSRRRIRWRSRVALSGIAAGRAGAVWREDYNDDLAKLKSLLGNLGCAIPPLYKQYSELCEPGGVQFIDFGSDPDFNNCVDGLVLVDLTYLKANRYQRYIEAHI